MIECPLKVVSRFAGKSAEFEDIGQEALVFIKGHLGNRIYAEHIKTGALFWTR